MKSNYCLHGLLKVKAITSLLIIIMEAESKKSLLRDDNIKFSGDKLKPFAHLLKMNDSIKKLVLLKNQSHYINFIKSIYLL